MRKIPRLRIIILFVIILFPWNPAFARNVGYTQEDRDRLIKIETTLKEFKESVDKRFEQIDKRFQDMFNFLWILTGIFTALTVGILGFSYWDRRTIIKKAREDTIEAMENSGIYYRLLSALRELAKKDKKLAEVLQRFNLL